MKKQDNRRLYDELRREFPVFVFDAFDYELTEGSLRCRFSFSLPGKCDFFPVIEIPSRNFIRFKNIDEAALRNLLFHIGMVELVSYWKAACPPRVIIRPFRLNEAQAAWFRNLYFNGLGEFFYLNGLEVSAEDFMQFEIEGTEALRPFDVSLTDGYLIPVGGGKDSIVTLELLRNRYNVRPLIINPRGATIQTAAQAGFGRNDIVEVKRTLDPALLRLNDEGFLNGHTPFSALIAFISLLCSGITGFRNIALSNEASADESTIIGTDINHQYSKTYGFEKGFRDYCRENISAGINYFSFLRPLHEIQIAKVFSGFSQYFSVFKSCNAGSKTDEWCGKCAKCLFTYIMLAPFLESCELIGIFGADLLNKGELKTLFDGLTGIGGDKPFDCVGTLNEVNLACCAVIHKRSGAELPLLLEYYRSKRECSPDVSDELPGVLKTTVDRHFLNGDLMKLIRERL